LNYQELKIGKLTESIGNSTKSYFFNDVKLIFSSIRILIINYLCLLWKTV